MIDVFALFARLPPEVVTRLAAGPRDEPACGVCHAFDDGHDAWMERVNTSPPDDLAESFLGTVNALNTLGRWHDPIKDEHVVLRPLGKVVEHLGWKIAEGPTAGLDARTWFFETNGEGHRWINDIGGELSYPRCLLLYVLAGWSPA